MAANNPKAERVLVAMSGGVDSSVAAARLHDAGWDVIGVTLHLWDYDADSESSPAATARTHGRCCAPEDQYDARRVADAVGFPHFTFDRRAQFAHHVVGPFVEAYLAGETPSPCTACNRGVKLAELFALADRLGATHVATGHYARVVRSARGVDRGQAALRIAMGADTLKDQSYFLYATPPSWLQRLLFPLGDSSKSEVRGEAVARNLPGAHKGESQELCFVGAGAHAYATFVNERAAGRVRPGLVVDDTGKPLAEHDGVHRFTVGQRKGLGLARGKPTFVTRIDPETATVHVGDGDALLAVEAYMTDLVLAEGVELPVRARVRIRYRHEGQIATVSGHDGGARVVFDAPVRAVTPGQTAVLYDDNEHVLGGGRLGAAQQRTREGPPSQL